MLNYIWLALIVIGVLVAVWNDFNDLLNDRYRNNEDEIVSIKLVTPVDSLDPKISYPCSVLFRRSEFMRHELPYRGAAQRAELISINAENGTLRIFVDENAPPYWKKRYAAQKSSDFLIAKAKWSNKVDSPLETVWLKFDPVKFVKLNAVTNDGIIKYAKTAVELAIGLIGIMALWLGVMKIAEQSGLVALLAKALRPVTTRLFPDVPADHPAMGAMIMNISANMLGLNNAATPLGLKAMEELNKLNKKLGTATDAMVTFLVINTSNLQIIPASVIAIRAASGSANPAEIIGAVILVSALTMVIAIITVKLIAKLPGYRKQLAVEEE